MIHLPAEKSDDTSDSVNKAYAELPAKLWFTVKAEQGQGIKTPYSDKHARAPREYCGWSIDESGLTVDWLQSQINLSLHILEPYFILVSNCLCVGLHSALPTLKMVHILTPLFQSCSNQYSHGYSSNDRKDLLLLTFSSRATASRASDSELACLFSSV